MSFRANRLRHSSPDEDGYVLPSVILVLTVGAMVAIALLGYAAALLKAGGDDADSVLHLYAADAGITTMKHRLKQGTVTPPTPFMFGDDITDVTVKVEIRTSQAPLGTLTPQPIILGLPDLSDEYSVIIESVPPGSELNVRWRYVLPRSPSPQLAGVPPPAQPTDDPSPTPTPTPTGSPQPTSTPTPVPPSIKVYVPPRSVAEGTPTPIVTSVPCPDDQRNCVEIVEQPLEREEDIEVVFDTGEDMVSAPQLARACPARRNISYFCLTAAPMDYVVVSTAGSATVTAYIRRFPRWKRTGELDDPPYDVIILSWKPYSPDE